jgi:SAM-dependent methyltransferase
MSEITLISPDDGTILRKSGEFLIDESGNRYSSIDGILDLRPKKPIEGVIRYRLLDHESFRSYKYQKSLVPLFPDNKETALDVKETNISGFIPLPHVHAKCLDHGCGAGKLRSFLESLGYTYIGVDNEIGVTAEQGGGDRFKGGATHLCDLHKLPFADNTFQFAVSYSVFEHLQNPFLAAAELLRVMEPGGICFVAISAVIPFHMDSFYHHTHYGVLSTFQGVGFEVNQIAGANWNAYIAISAMDGLPGPKWIRLLIGGFIYGAHRFLWYLRTRLKGKNSDSEELRRHLMMAGMIKTVLVKP